MYVLVHDLDGNEALIPIEFEMAPTGFVDPPVQEVDKAKGSVVSLSSKKKPEKVRCTVVYLHSGNTFLIRETPAELKALINEVRYDVEGEYSEEDDEQESGEEDPCAEDGEHAGC